MTAPAAAPAAPNQPAPQRLSPDQSVSGPAAPAGPDAGPDPRSTPARDDDSVQALATLIGALAVLAASAAIPPMISGSAWWWPTVEVVAVIWLVGVGARLARVPAAAAMLLQAAAVSIALTALFTTGGFGGVLPNGAVLGEAGELLSGAWDQIRQSVPPADATVELSFLTALSVGATALIVDILIAVCRAPALVALPLLCVFSVPASIDLDMLPWFAFAGPAVLYALLLVATGLQGRRIGAGAGAARVVAGVALAAVTIVIALLAASAITTIGTEGRLPRTGLSDRSAGVGLSPFASLEGNLTRGEPVDMLRVSGLPEPDYLRTVGLQQWTPGEGWSIDTLSGGRLPNTTPPPDAVTVTVTSAAFRDRFLPIYSGSNEISGTEPGWFFDVELESVHRDEAVTPGPYQITVSETRPTADQLRLDTVTPGGILTETGELNGEVISVTDQITADQPTAFDTAQALTNYFTDPANGFTYSLDVPEGDSGDPLVDFLRNKQGFCEQYASAMAVMLRHAGVPARVAVGFTQGTLQSDGSYLITSNDAHAWVEVLFNSAGWVRFDPTPLGAGQGGQQGFVPPTGADSTAPSASVATQTAAGLSPDDFPTGDNTDDIPTVGAAPGTSAESATGPDIGPTVWFVLLAMLLFGAIGAAPSLVRGVRRRRRLAAGAAGGPGAAEAVWREIEDLAVDHGLGTNPAESARATANRLAKAGHLDARGRDQLRDVVIAAERDWYGAAVADSGGASRSMMDSAHADPAGPLRAASAGAGAGELRAAPHWPDPRGRRRPDRRARAPPQVCSRQAECGGPRTGCRTRPARWRRH